MKSIATQIVKVIAVIFIFSIIYSLTAMYPDYGTSYNMGFSTGSTFIQMIKTLGTISLIVYGVRTMKGRTISSLD
jgi:hypothetical protein